MAELPVYLRDVQDGCSITVKVHPRARRRRVVGPHGDALKIEVVAPPAGGAANSEVETLIADLLEVPKNQVAVTQGLTSRRKVIVVRGLGARTVAGFLPGYQTPS